MFGDKHKKLRKKTTPMTNTYTSDTETLNLKSIKTLEDKRKKSLEMKNKHANHTLNPWSRSIMVERTDLRVLVLVLNTKLSEIRTKISQRKMCYSKTTKPPCLPSFSPVDLWLCYNFNGIKCTRDWVGYEKKE